MTSQATGITTPNPTQKNATATLNSKTLNRQNKIKSPTQPRPKSNESNNAQNKANQNTDFPEIPLPRGIEPKSSTLELKRRNKPKSANKRELPGWGRARRNRICDDDLRIRRESIGIGGEIFYVPACEGNLEEGGRRRRNPRGFVVGSSLRITFSSSGLRLLHFFKHPSKKIL